MDTTTLNLNAASLSATSQSGSTEQAAQPVLTSSSPPAAKVEQDQTVRLRPRPVLWMRKVLACAWSGYLIISPLDPTTKLDYCLLGLVVLGTFRTTTVSASQIEWRYRFGFIPYHSSRLSLVNQISLLTGWEERSGLGEALLLGLWAACFAPLADWLCPWPGGSYRLWVKNSHGQRVLVWRGRVQRTFHRNHKLLSQVTRLPSQRVLSH